MALVIGGPAPIAATAPTSPVNGNTAHAADMARQAAATPGSQKDEHKAREEADRTRSPAAGLNAPVTTHEVAATHHDRDPNHKQPQKDEDQKRPPKDHIEGRGDTIDVEA